MKIYKYCGIFLLTLFLSMQLCANVSAAESIQNSIGISELSGSTEYSEDIVVQLSRQKSKTFIMN